MYRRDWRLFLMEILESINKIEKYTENISKGDPSAFGLRMTGKG
jgi:uncharacterized protein with HEPN domain